MTLDPQNQKSLRPINEVPCNEVNIGEFKQCTLGVKELLIQKQKELDSFIEKLKPQLLEISRKHHYALGEIFNVTLEEEGVSFMAGGIACGYFEEPFYVEWERLNLDFGDKTT